MCTVSNIGDYYGDRWKYVPVAPQVVPFPYTSGIGREEFDALKREVEEMKELLKAAKRIDELTGQPDCEIEPKLEVLRRVAELVGVDLSDVIPESPIESTP